MKGNGQPEFFGKFAEAAVPIGASILAWPMDRID